MLPRECQDVAMQMRCGRRLKYEELRCHILGVANQKAQMVKPVPTDVVSVEEQQENVQDGKEG